MNTLEATILQYNKTVEEIYPAYASSYFLEKEAIVPAEEVQKLEQLAGCSFPDDLKELYEQFGVIRTENDESLSILTHKVPDLIKGLEQAKDPEAWKHRKIFSLGIIDMIKAAWGNDRQEYDPESGNFTQAEIDFLNQNYICFGHYRTFYGFESADYLYFDQDGNYGSFHYHQDELRTDLKTLLAHGITGSSLSDLLENKIEFLRIGMIAMRMEAYEASEIIEGFNREWEPDVIKGIGIVDLIMASMVKSYFSVGSPIFDMASHLSQDEIQELNENYKSFGWQNKEAPVSSITYFYHDKNNQFSSINYQKNDMETLCATLKNLSKKTDTAASVDKLLEKSTDWFMA